MFAKIWRDVVFVLMGLSVCAAAAFVALDRVAPLV
jgi:hypothetical protein